MRDDVSTMIRKASLVVLILALAGMALLAFSLWMSWYFVISTIKHVVSDLAGQSGISTNLLYGVVIIATIPFFWAVAHSVSAMWTMLFGSGPVLKLYKSLYGIIIVVYVGLYFLAMFAAARGTVHGRYCAKTPEGTVIFDDPVKDPIYGIQAEPCTIDDAVEVRRVENPGLGPQRVQVVDARNFPFFEPVTGHPRIWYHKATSGEYEFFDRMGSDPSSGDPLHAIDPQAREDAIRLQDQRTAAPKLAEEQRLDQARIEAERNAQEQKRAKEHAAEEQRAATARADSERRASYLLVRYLNIKVELVVAAESSAKAPMDSIAAAIVRNLKSKGRTASSNVFSPSFVTSGEFDLFFDGKGNADTQQMPLSAIGDNILLVRVHTNYVRPGTASAGLVTASIAASFRVLSSRDASPVDGFEIEAAGAGTTDDDAKSAAIGHVLDKLGQHGY